MTASKPPLSVSFHNFWRGFVAEGSFFARALAQSFNVEIVNAGNDLQISSVYGARPLPAISTGRPLRVWWTGEVEDPRAQIFDLYFGFRPQTSILGKRWFRYPLWITYIDWWDPTSVYHIDRLVGPRRMTERKRFCNFVYSNETSIRAEFFLWLNEARPVGSYGRVLNKSGNRVEGRQGKMAILADSTFTIAFENQFASGYVTEKLVEPLLAGSIPIYWGAAEAKTDFNPDAFVYAEDFASMQDLVRYVLRLADSSDALTALASAPPLIDGRIPYEHTPEFFVDRVSEALSGPPQPTMADRWQGPWTPPAGVLRMAERKVRQFRYSLVGNLPRRKGRGRGG